MPDRRLVLAALLAAGALGGCGDAASHRLTTFSGPVTSWVDGQPSLSTSAQFLAITVRAGQDAARRDAARHQELVLIAEQRLAAKRHAHLAALRRYEQQRRLALERYREQLRRAQAEKARQLAELRRREREREALLARMRKAREVTPGKECSLPQVRAQFNCMTGHTPIGKRG